MTAPTDTDAWCDLIEMALADDSPDRWAEAAAWPVSVEDPADGEEHVRRAQRLGELLDRVRDRHDATRAELDELAEERRQLMIHARALTSYAASEGGPPIDRLLRMMLVG